MRYLLDSDHASLLREGRSLEAGRIAARMSAHPPTDFALPVPGLHEQFLGAHTYIARARTPQNLARGYRLLQEMIEDARDYAIAAFDQPAAALFEAHRQQKVRIGTMDLRIAAIALSRGLTLLTRNLADFAQVPGLVCEVWTA